MCADVSPSSAVALTTAHCNNSDKDKYTWRVEGCVLFHAFTVQTVGMIAHPEALARTAGLQLCVG